MGNVQRYVSERTEKATWYKIWPSSRDHTRIEMTILHNDVIRECCNNPMAHTIKWTRASSVLGSTPNLEDGNAPINVSINYNDDESSEGISDEHQVEKNLGTKRKTHFQEEALYLEKRKIKLTEERLMKKSQADKDMFLISLLTSIKILDDFQRLELRV